jgi:diguanylate cyclase (GGDEF)-like protein
MHAYLRIPSRDFYADSDMRLAGRMGAALFALSMVYAGLVWSAYPPTAHIGSAGWVVAGTVVLAIAVTTALSALCLLSPGQLLATSYLAAAALVSCQWLSGASAPFLELMLVIAVYAGAIHPVRRIIPLYAFLLLVAAAPLAWEGWSWTLAATQLATAVLSLGIGVAALVWTARTRRLGGEVREERDRAEQLARTDVLTGLGNRRALAEILGKGPIDRFGLLLVDLHDFKSVNERYGHQAGDFLLAAVARELERAVRRVDACFRWGGDEFLVVIPAATEHVCAEVAARVAQRLALCRKPDGSRVEVAIGEAEANPCDTLDTLIGRADQRLLLSKAARRPLPTPS